MNLSNPQKISAQLRFAAIFYFAPASLHKKRRVSAWPLGQSAKKYLLNFVSQLFFIPLLRRSIKTTGNPNSASLRLAKNICSTSFRSYFLFRSCVAP
jgi:hypothetical protein